VAVVKLVLLVMVLAGVLVLEVVVGVAGFGVGVDGEVLEMEVMIMMMMMMTTMMISLQVLIFNETPEDSASQSVPRGSQGIQDQFPNDPRIYFCNGYFEMYLFL
jgi:hypothetical protein